MLAGLDGIERELDPASRWMPTSTSCRRGRSRPIGRVPGSLEASLDALEAYDAFLHECDVFTTDLIESYVRYKREAEVDAIRLRPHPCDFALYHDA